MRKRDDVTIEKRPAKGSSGVWVLRDAKSGKFIHAKSKPASVRSIEKATSENANLLDRLAKR